MSILNVILIVDPVYGLPVRIPPGRIGSSILVYYAPMPLF